MGCSCGWAPITAPLPLLPLQVFTPRALLNKHPTTYKPHLGVCLPWSPTCDIEQAGDRDPETEKAPGAMRSTGSWAEGAHSQWQEEEGRWQRVVTVLPGAAAEQLTAKPVPPAVSHSQPSAAPQLLSQFCRGSVRSQGCTSFCVGQGCPCSPSGYTSLFPVRECVLDRECSGLNGGLQKHMSTF